MRIVRSIMLKGAMLAELQFDMLALGGLMALAMIIAVSRFRRTLEGAGLVECRPGRVSAWTIGLRQAVEPDERQFVPIAPLKGDPSVNDMEEAAAAQPFWIPPFQDRPLAIRKQVFANADHLGGVKARLEHRTNGIAAVNRAFGNLVVIKGGERTHQRRRG